MGDADARLIDNTDVTNPIKTGVSHGAIKPGNV